MASMKDVFKTASSTEADVPQSARSRIATMVAVMQFAPVPPKTILTEEIKAIEEGAFRDEPFYRTFATSPVGILILEAAREINKTFVDAGTLLQTAADVKEKLTQFKSAEQARKEDVGLFMKDTGGVLVISMASTLANHFAHGKPEWDDVAVSFECVIGELEILVVAKLGNIMNIRLKAIAEKTAYHYIDVEQLTAELTECHTMGSTIINNNDVVKVLNAVASKCPVNNKALSFGRHLATSLTIASLVQNAHRFIDALGLGKSSYHELPEQVIQCLKVSLADRNVSKALAAFVDAETECAKITKDEDVQVRYPV